MGGMMILAKKIYKGDIIKDLDRPHLGEGVAVNDAVVPEEKRIVIVRDAIAGDIE
jgi:hypothetical protein